MVAKTTEFGYISAIIMRKVIHLELRAFRFLSAFLVLAFSAHSQPFGREVDAIPVSTSTGLLQLPWAGGINAPHFQFVDIDGDGDVDLFIVDRDNNGVPHADFYRNEGASTDPNFKLRPNVITLPVFSSWFKFIDLNGDGRKDLLTDDGTTGMNYFVNTGTLQNPSFTLLIASMADSAGNPINAGSYSVPAFADIDGDGRMDFFSGNIIGTVNYYRNVGSTSVPNFRLMTESWQGIQVISGGSCGGFFLNKNTSRSSGGASPSLHGASAYFFGDLDSDGDVDLLWGDLFASGLYYFRNTGTTQNAQMVLVDTNCFPSNEPVATNGGNQSALVDIDGDGDLDLFVGVGVVSGAIVQRHGFLFYENIGTPNNPHLVKRTEDYLSMLDVGREAQPVFVDLHGDGVLDMVIGSTNGELWYFRNTGTTTLPSFTLTDSAFIATPGMYTSSPAFIDIDGDGDKDLFIGFFDGSLRFYRNVGSPQLPQFVQSASPVDTIHVPNYSSPAFVDLDGDGDFDLFVGQYNGRLKFYRNTGDSLNFVPVLESAFYQDITAGEYAKPRFIDIDGDGDFDLFIGTSEGRIEFYENIGTPSNEQFVFRTNHYAATDPMQEATPAFADFDGDGDLDLFAGNLTGGVHFYRNQIISSVIEDRFLPSSFKLSQNFPNPFNPSTTMEYSLSKTAKISLKVFDILGREVANLAQGVRESGRYSVFWDAKEVATGIYFARLESTGIENSSKLIVETKKLVILK